MSTLSQFSADITAQRKQSNIFPFDFFFSSQPQDILAPHPDSFEHDLDLSLAAEDPASFKFFPLDPSPALNLVRAETPKCGPPSAFTVSSESTYDSLSSHSESLYPSSFSSYGSSDLSALSTLDMDFDRIRFDTMSDYGSVTQQSTLSTADIEAAVEAAGFGLPPTPPYSPDACTNPQETFSDYDSAFTQLSPFTATNTATTVAPINMSNPPQAVQPRPAQPSDDKVDPRKKYKCNVCPRAFARAYNLKTHMATHDPNRLKPHVCPHTACGRSFSRKHDLGRHLISIHKDEVHTGAGNKKSAIGTQKGCRVWCDNCGRSFDGHVDCDCQDSDK